MSFAVSISLCTRILGALPTFAFSVLPAVAALKVSANVPRAMVLATVLGAVSGFGGYAFAFLYNTPVGASQAVTACALTLVIWIFGEVRELGAKLVRA